MPSLDDNQPKKKSASASDADHAKASFGLLSGEFRSTASLPAVPDTGELPNPDTDKTRIPSAQLPMVVPTTNHQLNVPSQPNMAGTFRRMSPDTSEISAYGRRAPIVIQGNGQRKGPAQVIHPPHPRRRLYVTIAGVLSLLVIASITLLTVAPLGKDLGQNINRAAASGSNMFNNASNNPGNLVAQATATAVYHQQTDGYDPNANSGQVVSSGTGSLSWPIGQCTYWANLHYHALSGHWVTWSGNAWQWVSGARAAGWNVSTTPHVPSIIVLYPYTQGASGYGHVAVVENIVSNVTPITVVTSNMNWWAGNGGWDRESFVDFTVGYGVYFVWHS